MIISFTSGELQQIKKRGDIGVEDDQAVSVKRSFGGWIVHCLKFYNPFSNYRKEIIDQRAIVLHNINSKFFYEEDGDTDTNILDEKININIKGYRGTEIPIGKVVGKRKECLRIAEEWAKTIEEGRVSQNSNENCLIDSTEYPDFYTDDSDKLN